MEVTQAFRIRRCGGEYTIRRSDHGLIRMGTKAILLARGREQGLQLVSDNRRTSHQLDGS